MLQLGSDADVNGHIVRGLRRQEPGLDLIRSMDVLPDRTPDPVVLEWAAAEGRVLITNDRRTMVAFANQRVAEGKPMPGLIVTTNEQSVGSTINDILLIARESSPDDMRNLVCFLPL